MNRRRFLRMAGIGLAGTALLGTACRRVEEPAVSAPDVGISKDNTPTQNRQGTASRRVEEPAVSAPDVGISKDNTPTQNRQNLIKALSRSSEDIVFPPGDYLVDNSGPKVVIEGFRGKLTFDPSARLVFTDTTRRGLVFYGATGAEFYGLRTTFKTLPLSQVRYQECIVFEHSTDTLVRDANIRGSAAAGLVFTVCTRPRVAHAVITETMADGLHFANCQDARASDVLTENTGDDGVAFLNYTGYPDMSGGLATDVTVRKSRARGITVIGQKDVTIERFEVDRTAASGILCAYEENFRTPSNVRFVGGTVKNAGRQPGLSEKDPSKRAGVDFSGVGSVEFGNIRVISPATDGVHGWAPDGTVRLYNIRVTNAPGRGFDLDNAAYFLEDLSAQGTNRAGIVVTGSRLVKYGKLRSINVSKRDTQRRAFWFKNNAWLQGKELYVVDNQATPTGYIVGTIGSQSGTLGVVYDQVTNGRVQVDNASSLVWDEPSGQVLMIL
jgi:hypothetical protein